MVGCKLDVVRVEVVRWCKDFTVRGRGFNFVLWERISTCFE